MGRRPVARALAVLGALVAAAAEATDAILDAIAAELSVLRDEPVPPTRWDRRLRGRR